MNTLSHKKDNKIVLDLLNLHLHDLRTKVNSISASLQSDIYMQIETGETLNSIGIFLRELFALSEIETRDFRIEEHYFNRIDEILNSNKYKSLFTADSNIGTIKISNNIFPDAVKIDKRIELGFYLNLKFLSSLASCITITHILQNKNIIIIFRINKALDKNIDCFRTELVKDKQTMYLIAAIKVFSTFNYYFRCLKQPEYFETVFSSNYYSLYYELLHRSLIVFYKGYIKRNELKIFCINHNIKLRLISNYSKLHKEIKLNSPDFVIYKMEKKSLFNAKKNIKRIKRTTNSPIIIGCYESISDSHQLKFKSMRKNILTDTLIESLRVEIIRQTLLRIINRQLK